MELRNNAVAVCLVPAAAWGKRSFDILAAGGGLVLAAPIVAVAAVAIWLDDGFPILYRQARVGRGGTSFRLLKLRSMRTDGAGAAVTAAGDPRITRTGKWLRKYKLDELPQLWNVLKGDMSVVGPRPESPRYVDPQSAEWQTVLNWRPGITDLATLVYRNEEDLLGASAAPEEYYRQRILPDKLRLNLEYLAARSFWLDLRLILLTLRYSFWPSGFDALHVKRALSCKGER